ncbi:T9SS type A sorting domain-containing protein [Marixanthomonas spongiae]|uniref:Secretion system C-terminal sorting domain-containing protein n=1 Tax=Marixanthomonas spongiae TaxID=2174845 RepID=A0A2U0HU37_9FLAO|nr:T9SS type A sorting domain-containing protein [Marixanthomonas spongiae]PVW12339.1 hypothetical protein DDV96_15145 [Marixanthomonas spongiae]
MKPFYAFLVFFLCGITAINAQTIDVITGLANPSRLLMDGNDLYYSTPSEVFKIDVTQSSPTPVSVIGGLTTAAGMAKGGNILYIAEFNAGRISKIDVSDPTPTLETVISGLNTPNFLLLDGDTMYYSDNNADIVARFDVTDTNPTPEVVATSTVNFNPTGLALLENMLYMGQGQANRISKVDVTSGITQPTDVVTGINRPIGLRIRNNNLYITERNDNKISVKDLTDGATTATDLVTGLNLPLDIELSGSTLYILEGGANKISKVENILGVENQIFKNGHQLFPNPARDYLKISNLKESIPYTLFSMLGTKISQGIITPNGKINTVNLAQGGYFLSLANGANYRFIKN